MRSKPENEQPLVTVIVPARQEARHIGACLDSVLASDYPRDRLEVLVIDGMSTDGTREIIAAYASRFSFLRLIDNPRRTKPAALNAGIRMARGDVVVIMDAHTMYPAGYVSSLVGWLERSGADNVGGAWLIRPANEGRMARAIAAALSHPFGAGNAYYRIGAEQPRLVDTVPFGCYRRDVFDRIGGFDEELVRNQDDELNMRLVKAGGRILLVPEVKAEYVARESLGKLARMNYQYGYYKPLAALKLGRVYSWRQVVPAAFVLGVLAAVGLALVFPGARLPAIGLLGTYAVATATAAVVAHGRLGFGCRALLCLAFPTMHASYGVGYLAGALAVCRRGAKARRESAAVPLTR